MNNTVFFASAPWYVVQTKPRQEFRALEQLLNQGYECFLPTLQTERICRVKRKTCTEPLFSRYMFIRLSTIASNWAPIRSTRGVSGLLKFGDRLATLPNECIEALKAAPSVRLRELFTPGERVAVASGPFAGLEGIYQATDGEARAMVLIEMMNQPQRLSFAIGMLRKAA